MAELPATVAALEARAAEARAELDVIASLGPSGSSDADVLGARRQAAAAHLAAGADDLAPLTTLIDAARVLGEDVSRLADAQREVSAGSGRRALGAGRITTPA